MEKFLNTIKYYHVNKYITYCESNILIYLTLFNACDEHAYISATIHGRYTVWMLMCTQKTYTKYYSHKHMRLMGFDIITNIGEKVIQCYICKEISGININLMVQTFVISLQTYTCSHTGEKTYQCKCNGMDLSEISRQTGYFVMILYQYNHLHCHLHIYILEIIPVQST